MIGDTMETDILGATQMGYFSVLVLSGGTRKDELSNFSYRPDLVVSSVADLLETEALSKFFNQNGSKVGASSGLTTKENTAFT